MRRDVAERRQRARGDASRNRPQCDEACGPTAWTVGLAAAWPGLADEAGRTNDRWLATDNAQQGCVRAGGTGSCAGAGRRSTSAGVLGCPEGRLLPGQACGVRTEVFRPPAGATAQGTPPRVQASGKAAGYR